MQEEPYGEEAYLFMRQLALQRSVEIEVETVDRCGTQQHALRLPHSLLLSLSCQAMVSTHEECMWLTGCYSSTTSRPACS